MKFERGKKLQVKKAEKRNSILATALRLFSENSFEDVTTDMIAKESHVGKGTIYTYFKNKNEIFIEGFSVISNKFVKIAEDVDNCECDISEKIDMLFKSFYKISSAGREVYYIFMKLYVDNRLSEKRVEFQRKIRNEIMNIFKPFEVRLAFPLEEVVNFMIVNIMPFGMQHFAQDEEYWNLVAKVMKKALLKD